MAENETSSVDHALALIAALVNGDSWLSADACAVYLGQKPGSRVIDTPGFPAPKCHGGRGLWDVLEVEAWATTQRGSPTCLYRHFDATGNLLYVGISLSAVQRLSEHRGAAPWFREIASITVEWFDSRTMAVIAERTAIREERPLHNKQGSVQ